MRCGFTTGSCAAAAAKAACYMLLTGRKKRQITIITPKGIPFTADIEEITRQERQVSCGVRKDGGDDPDITTGALICAKVCFADKRESDEAAGKAKPVIYIDGGVGVGRVTKPGLDQPVGNAAINHVPREMIERELREVCSLCDYTGALARLKDALLEESKAAPIKVYGVANCGMENERRMYGLEEIDEQSGYLTVVIVR